LITTVIYNMENINTYGTQLEQEEEEEEVVAEELSGAAVAAPLLAITPVEAHVNTIWIPSQNVTRAQLQHLLDCTDWAEDDVQVYFVGLEGDFSKLDLVHILHTTNWAPDLDDNWADDGRFDEGGVGTLRIPQHRGSGSGSGLSCQSNF
jgi:hypothetical protein